MTPCGTVGYTAPEIVKDERYSKSVDMWALGCVLYTLLCGFPPFYDESIQVLTEKVARGQYTFLSPWWDDISKPAQDLVSHLLTVDPERRYTIQQFLNHPWIGAPGKKLTLPPMLHLSRPLSTLVKRSTASGIRSMVAQHRPMSPPANISKHPVAINAGWTSGPQVRSIYAKFSMSVMPSTDKKKKASVARISLRVTEGQPA